MPRLEIKSIQEGQDTYLRNVLNYVAKWNKCNQGYLGAANLYLPQKKKELIPTIQQQNQELREFYRQENKRLGIHFIVAFSPEEAAYLTHMYVLQIGYFLAQTEFAEYMAYFAVHDHTELLHLDMLINPINIHTGLMFGCNRSGWYGIGSRLQEHLLRYMPEGAIRELQVTFSK